MMGFAAPFNTTGWHGPFIDIQEVKDLSDDLIQLNQAALILQGIKANYANLGRIYAFTSNIDESYFESVQAELEAIHETIRAVRKDRMKEFNAALGIEEAPKSDSGDIAEIPF